jgi:hypothetical protein
VNRRAHRPIEDEDLLLQRAKEVVFQYIQPW